MFPFEVRLGADTHTHEPAKKKASQNAMQRSILRQILKTRVILGVAS
jgi:hypothetical protein